jgi:hypothetical protein
MKSHEINFILILRNIVLGLSDTRICAEFTMADPNFTFWLNLLINN